MFLILIIISLFIFKAKQILFVSRLSYDFNVILLRSNGQQALNGNVLCVIFLGIHVAGILLHASDSSSLLLHILALALLASELLHHDES